MYIDSSDLKSILDNNSGQSTEKGKQIVFSETRDLECKCLTIEITTLQ